MDLERIKQNLRLRSGRTKKVPKKSAGQTSKAATQNARPVAVRASTPPENKDAVASSPKQPPDTPKSESKQSASKASEKVGETPARKVDSGVGSSQSNSEQHRDRSGVDADSDLENQSNGRQAAQKTQEQQEDTVSRHGDIRREKMKKVETTHRGTITDEYTLGADTASDADDFDLKPPAPKPKPPSLDSLSELLFSAGHLNTLTHHPDLLIKFTAFLQRYRPQDYPVLMRYLETSKAISAIEYANAVAGGAPPLAHDTDSNQSEVPGAAAVLDTSFRESCSAAFDTLVNTTLPLYVTYSLVRVLSECLVDEITGRKNSLTRDMVGGLSEVFCLTDPNQEDNPIVYASEEFYRLTGYGQDDVIGRNCRFLQGPKTLKESPRRLKASLEKGEEVYETLLNYRRDGKPFVNVLMIAPLHDNKGKLKYEIGAQVDVSSLIQNGKILDGFQRYLAKKDADQRRRAKEYSGPEESKIASKKKALDKLRELSELFDLEESAIIQSHSRSSSRNRDDDTKSVGSGNARRRILDSDDSESDDEMYEQEDAWKLGQEGPRGMSGKLPGVYEKYMLIRPAPSLRIVFVSPKLRKFGNIAQHAFMGHVAAPSGILAGLDESFKNGIPVSTKINFMPQYSDQRKGTIISPNERHEDGKYGRACWIAATPLLGSDDRVGVWMIVFVEKAQAKSKSTKARKAAETSLQDQGASQTSRVEQPEQPPLAVSPGPPGTNHREEDGEMHLHLPIKPKRLDYIVLDTIKDDASRSPPAVVYRSKGADPVEEYHSADERGGAAEESPTYTAPEGEEALQSPKRVVSTGENFVQPRIAEWNERSRNRLTIHGDDDDDDEDQNAGARNTTNVNPHRISIETESLETAPEEIVNPDEIEPSIPSDAEFASDHEAETLEEKTPTRPTIAEQESEFGLQSEETIRHRSPLLSPSKSPVSSPIDPDEKRPTPRRNQSYKSNAAQRAGNLPAGLSYMDYLRHPGSSRQNSGEIERGRRKNRPGLTREWTDSECAGSPYSVD